MKLFLKPSGGMKGSDYFWLESAANMIYSDTGDVRAARLVMKYYLIHSNMEKKSYIEAGNGSYPIDLKESFFEMYPELQDVVEWPDEN